MLSEKLDARSERRLLPNQFSAEAGSGVPHGTGGPIRGNHRSCAGRHPELCCPSREPAAAVPVVFDELPASIGTGFRAGAPGLRPVRTGLAHATRYPANRPPRRAHTRKARPKRSSPCRLIRMAKIFVCNLISGLPAPVSAVIATAVVAGTIPARSDIGRPGPISASPRVPRPIGIPVPINPDIAWSRSRGRIVVDHRRRRRCCKARIGRAVRIAVRRAKADSYGDVRSGKQRTSGEKYDG